MLRSRHLLPGLILAVGLGCQKKTPPAVATSPDAPPILPSPEGSMYALGETRPADPLVFGVVNQGLVPWTESLSGAATTIALDTTQAPVLATAQWAAIRAGYPHPVVTIIEGTEPPGSVPTELLDALIPRVHIGDHVGLVRARTAAGDRWVALVGRPGVELAPFSREHPVGASLEVSGNTLSPFALVSPSGDITRGRLPLKQPLDEAGEWWLEFQASVADETPVFGVPIYVGVPTPKAPTVPLDPDLSPPGPQELVDQSLDALFDIRSAFGLTEFTWDATLASLASTPVQQVLSGSWNAESGVKRLRGAGFIGGPAAQLTCTAPSVSACITSLMHRASDRAHLLDPGLKLVGVAGEVRTSGITLVLNFSSE